MMHAGAFSRVVVPEATISSPPQRARLSGVGGDGDTDGTVGAWIGTPTTIAATWADQIDTSSGWDPAEQLLFFHGPNDPNYAQGHFWTWNAPIDLAIGGPQNGETWATAASGGVDARWTRDLTALRKLWNDVGKTGTIYLRFAHEFNGNWYPWTVNPGQEANFAAAFKRYTNLARSILGGVAKLVMCMNADTVSGIDWRLCDPGPAYVDVYSVDYYNNYPWVNTAADFASNSMATSGAGAPKGVEQYRLYAAAQGRPLAISEWGTPQSLGEATGWLQAFHDYLLAHGGSGPGQILYELLFNVTGFLDGTGKPAYSFYPTTALPATAALYRTLWGV